MKDKLIYIPLFLVFLLVSMCRKDKIGNDDKGNIQLVSVKIGNSVLDVNADIKDVPVDQPVRINFASAIDTATIRESVAIKDNNSNLQKFSFSMFDKSTLLLFTTSQLAYSSDFTLTISENFKGLSGESFPGIEFRFTTEAGSMNINSVTLNGLSMAGVTLQGINPKNISIRVTFSQTLNPDNYQSSLSFTGAQVSYGLSSDMKTIIVSNTSSAGSLRRCNLSVSSNLKSQTGYTFSGYNTSFYTGIDSTYKFPELTDDDLLTLVEQQTFKYFWDFGHPSCGMARERNSSGDVVTTGGSGFGVMAMIVGMQRGFISRTDGKDRLDKILSFLETCERFHGAWPHWLNGTTGKTVPFSAKDNGGDLVETSFMLQGLITMRQYLDSTDSREKTEILRINNLLKTTEFDWYTNNEKTLYWAWSPDYGYNLKIQGYNETLITYVIAASSTTHPVSADTYTSGYAGNGSIKNGRSYFGYILPLGNDYGGPLFFTHYSFLGLDPRNLSDQFANYWQQNVNQSLINWKYCINNPVNYPGYGQGIWGLTASDNPWGYSAHSPTNDLGVISPTAAISSIPYTPVQSLSAIKNFYYFLGDKLWGAYGFYDAFDVKENWWANSTIAIDQGPEIIMIENYRTGLIWNLFMSAPDIRNGLTKLGFTY